MDCLLCRVEGCRCRERLLAAGVPRVAGFTEWPFGSAHGPSVTLNGHLTGQRRPDLQHGREQAAGNCHVLPPRLLVTGGRAASAGCWPPACARIKATIRLLTSLVSLKPPWLPGTTATAASGRWLAR